MFSDPTVFVVGAGASAEYGVAVGDTLKQKIADLLNFYFEGGLSLTRGDHQIVETLKRYNHSQGIGYGLSNEQFEAAHLISDAMPHALSIDNFVDAHRGNEAIALCAKLGILKAILVEERRSRLAGLIEPHKAFDFSAVTDGWITRLFQMLTENVAKSEIETVFENLTLIVFNYDRCLEAYLPRALQQYYGLSQHEADSLLTKLSIIHPYGIAGTLSPTGQLSGPFGSLDVNLFESAHGIRTFSEGIADPKLGESIELALNDAHTLVFLGFSFHPLNLELLKADAPCLRRIFATTFGLSRSAVTTIEQNLLELYNKLDPTSLITDTDDYGRQLDELELVDLTAFEFCTQYFRSLSTVRIAA